MRVRVPYVFVPTAVAVVLAGYGSETWGADTVPAGDEKPERIVVQGTRAHFDVPEAPVQRPEMPDLKLKLPAYSLESRDFIFPSGLRMIFQADHSQPVVAVTNAIDKGSAADPLGKEGIAHFVEHLWFRGQHLDASDPTGQKRLPKVWDILSDLGCDLNAFTADDDTTYMSVCPATSLKALIRLESLRFENAVEGVVESVVDTERDVIRNELRMRYENDDFGNVLPFLFQKLYPDGHPYASLGIGTHESLFNCHLADIQQFVDVNYVPQNSTITVVGDFDIDSVSKLISENFDPKFLVDPKQPDAPLKLVEKLPPRIDRSVPPSEPPAPKDQTMGVYEANVEQPLIVIGWTVPGGYRGNDANYNIAANIAGSYIANYFDQNDPRVDVEQTGCFLWPSRVDSKVVCVIGLKKSVDADKIDPEQIAQRAADQVSFVWNPDYLPGGVVMEEGQKYLDIELDRARMQELARTLRSLDLFAAVGEESRATTIALHAMFTGSITAHSDQMNDTMLINRQGIVDFAYKYLRRERMVNVYLKPIPEDELAMDASQGSDYVAASGDDNVVRSTITADEITKEVIEDFTITPRIDLMKEKVLPNGLRVVVLEHGEAPLVEAGLFVHGGPLTQTPFTKDEIADYSVDNLWDRWTPQNRKLDPLRIAGSWARTSDKDWEYRYVDAASGNLDGALWFLREGVEEMKINMDGRVEYVKDNRDYLKRLWKERDYWLTLAQDRHVYGDSPLGQVTYDMPSWEEWEASKLITGADALAYMRSKYQPKNATLLVVGNVDGDDALALAEYYFQGWAPAKGVVEGEAPRVAPPTPITAEPEILLFDHPGRTQANVTWACPVDAGKPEQDALRGAMTDYLDELTWIILRENSGVTYGASGYVVGHENGSSGLYMGSLVQNDGLIKAIHAFQDVAHQMETGAIKADRVAVQKLNRGKKYVNRQQSVPQMRSRLLQPLQWRQPWSYVEGYADRLADVTPADMQKAMADCTKHYVITIDGPVDALKPGLDAAGIAYKVFDYKQARKDMLAKYDPKTYKKVLKAEAKAEAKKAKEEAETPETPAPAPAPAPETPAPPPEKPATP